jgi:septal ring factor EnvC (AmiA/AmiB activator)
MVDTPQPLLNRPRAQRWSAAGLLAIALGVCAAPAMAQTKADGAKADPAAKLQEVERKIRSHQAESERQQARAKALQVEMAAVNADLIAAARRVQDQEMAVAKLESELADLERVEHEKQGQLRDRRKQFSGVVMALTRIARFPTEALVAQPMSPEDTIRSAILLRAAVPTIEGRAVSLKGELKELASARSLVETHRSQLQSAADKLRDEENRIEVIRKQKAALRAEAISKSRAARSQAQELAHEARNLRDLMVGLQKEREKADAEAAARKKRDAFKKPSVLHVKPAPKSSVDIAALGGIGSISQARGRLPFPAVGKLVGAYGQPLEGGQTRKGLSIETRPGAQVIAPFEGKVVFAGAFRGYGQLLIIDHGQGYHSLLAGLGRIDTAIGQPVLAGEPVAVMAGGENGGPGRDSVTDNGTSSGGQAVLYVEFRRNNEPINPLPWLASRKGTPKG